MIDLMKQIENGTYKHTNTLGVFIGLYSFVMLVIGYFNPITIGIYTIVLMVGGIYQSYYYNENSITNKNMYFSKTVLYNLILALISGFMLFRLLYNYILMNRIKFVVSVEIYSGGNVTVSLIGIYSNEPDAEVAKLAYVTELNGNSIDIECNVSINRISIDEKQDIELAYID